MSNIKVHFASTESENHYLALSGADVHYALYSAYKFIHGNQNLLLSQDSHIPKMCNDFAGVIQDSGLFTLMFGVGKGGTYDLKFFEAWQDRIIEFVTQNHIKPTMVEIDCQKVLGVEQAWYLRERIKDKLPNHPHINVWHFEDGSKGLDRMLEFSDYIALSIPEWRLTRGGTYQNDIRYITHYIKNKKPQIDIHLLGCTEPQMLADNSYCTSSDSTSWLGPTRWGRMGDSHVSAIKKDALDQRAKTIRLISDCKGIKCGDKRLRDSTIKSICATAAKKEYEAACGNQD